MGEFPKSRLIIIGAAGLIGIYFILVFMGILPGLGGGGNENLPPPAETLVVWGVFDNGDAFQEALSAFGGASVQYVAKNPDTYEQDLLNAFASDNPPDIFMIHNSWLPKYLPKLAPAGEEQIPFAAFRQQFPQVVEQDFAPAGKIYALPLYLDTLALLYNREMFNNKHITAPPRTWAEFEEFIPRLRETDQNFRITKAAAAIGGSAKSINREADILSLLMLQSGAEMTNADFTAATFAESGADALDFYLKFAKPGNSVYTWNNGLPYSLDGFVQENIAMTFGYSYTREAVRERNSLLDFDVAPVPQPANALREVNYASYWGLAVYAKSKQPKAAWGFLIPFTRSDAAMRAYAATLKRPPALLSLIKSLQSDKEWGVFANQALTARSWPQVDNTLVDNAFSDMVESVLTGRNDSLTAIDQAQQKITEAMSRLKLNGN